MEVEEIYTKFSIPPNLQQHMRRVWGVVCFIEKHWIGEEVDWELTKTAALLHDLGNIVKFDLDKHPEFLGDEVKNLEYWKEAKCKTIQKYGSDDHLATKKMLEEAGINNKVISLIYNERFQSAITIRDSNDWASKLLFYSDLRVLPTMVGTLEERIGDAKKRYSKQVEVIGHAINLLITACREIENQIEENLDVPVSGINNNSINLLVL